MKLTSFEKLEVGDRFVFEHEILWEDFLERTNTVYTAKSVLPYVAQFIKLNTKEYVFDKIVVDNRSRKSKIKKHRGFAHLGAFVRKM